MFKKILFCTDFSENSHWAFTYTLNLAKTTNPNSLSFMSLQNHTTGTAFDLPPQEKLEELRTSRRKNSTKN